MLLRARPTRIPLGYAPGQAGAALEIGVLVAIHAAVAVAFVRGPSVRLVALAAATYAVRALAVRVGYHAYFAHRAFEASRGTQLLLALLGTTAAQRGPLRWASAHRLLHRCSALPGVGRDAHRAGARSGIGRLGFHLARASEPARLDLVPDLAGYPELRVVERLSMLGPLALMGLVTALGGFDGLLWGYAVSTAALLHTTFTLDLLAPTRAGLGARAPFARRAMERVGLVRGVRPSPPTPRDEAAAYPS